MNLSTVGTKDFRRTTLLPHQRRVVRAIAETLFADDPPPPPAELDSLTVEFDQFISLSSVTLRFGLALITTLVGVLPLFIIGKATTFDALSLDDRLRMLLRMEHARLPLLTLLVVAFKTVLTLIYYERPAQHEHMGYHTDRQRYRLPLAGNPSPLAVTAEARS